MPRDFHITVMAGDGIGPEVMAPCIQLLEMVAERFTDFRLRFDAAPAGAACYRETGDALPQATMHTARHADAILLGAMGLPDIRYADGTEIAPQLQLRSDLGLYAGVRPVRTLPGLPPVLSDPRAATLDFVLIRESTEGLFASHGKGEIKQDREASDTLVITREVSERLFDFAFRLAAKRGRAGRAARVTCVDKANVFSSFAFFRRVFYERAALFPELDADNAYVDATALNMVRRPWIFDVLVTENMFGDILSDLGAALLGGMGMAPSADIGDEHAVFQPCHGSAPDIAGQGVANPTAMFLSAAMMLDWLGDRHRVIGCNQASALLVAAVDEAYRAGSLIPVELGGNSGTRDIFAKVAAALDSVGLSAVVQES